MSSYALEGEAPRKARRRIAWLGTAVLLVLLVALGSTAGYLSWANRVPPLPPENRVYPEPNGLDRLLIASPGVPRVGRRSPLADPVRADLRALRRMTATRGETLRVLRAAVALPFLNPPIRTTDDPPDYCLEFPSAGWLIAVKARLELADGRAASAMNWALDAVELGSRAGKGAPAYFHEHARECSAMGAAMAERCLSGLSEREAADAARRLDRLMTQFSTFAEIMDEERHFRVAARHRVLTGADPAWVGGRAPSTYAMWEAKTRNFLSPKPAMLARLDREYAALEAYAHKSWPERRRASVPCPAIYRKIADKTGDLCAASDAQLRLLRLEIALQSHRRRTGAWPKSLNELSSLPDAAIRLDPFTGQPFQYRRKGNGYELYSYGRDATDNGGDPQLDVVAGELRSVK